MDLKKILHSLENCPCGRQHTFVTEIVEIESGLTARMGKILADANFPKKVLLVSDQNAMTAAQGTTERIEAAGFEECVRGETLGIPEFARIANEIVRRKGHV